MSRKPDIQYVTQFYSYGSEAKVLELKPEKKKHKFILPKAAPNRKIFIHVDPVAWTAIAAAAVLVILMAFSVKSYLNTCAEYERMTDYVIGLQNSNVENKQAYVKMYDLDDIQEKALALGMIPLEDAEVVTFSPVYPQPEPEVPWWDGIVWFLGGLFA